MTPVFHAHTAHILTLCDIQFCGEILEKPVGGINVGLGDCAEQENASAH